jgi:hypothetical protein
MGGWTDSHWNGNFTVLTQGCTTNQFQFAVSPAADEVPTAGSFTPNYTNPTMRRPDGFLNWAMFSSGLDFGEIYNAALGSRTMADIAAAFGTDVMPLGPGVLIQGGGTNDALGAVATATSLAALESIIQMAQQVGFRVVLLTVPPLTSSTTVASAILAYNKGLRALAKTYKCVVWDWYEIMADPASAAGGVASGMIDTTDSTHPTPLAHKMLGEIYAAPYLADIGFGTPINLIKSAGDVIGTLTGSDNIHPIMTGTGGGVTGTGASGVSLTGWSLTGSITGGNATTVANVIAGQANSAQFIQISGTGGNASILGPSITTNYAAGDVLQFSGRIDVNIPTNFTMVCQLRAVYNGVTFTLRPLMFPGNSLPLPAGNYPIIFQSEPWTVPAVAPASLQAQVQVLPIVSTTGSITLSQFTIRKL